MKTRGKRKELQAAHRFINQHRHSFSIGQLCRVLQVAPSGFYGGFYARSKRPLSRHQQQDEVLKVHISDSFERSRRSYGSPRIHQDLRSMDHNCARKRVARLMQEMGLAACKRRRTVKTTDSSHALPVVANRLNREYQVEKIQELNRTWAGDITYIPTAQGWLYLAVVLDLKSRRVIGWSMTQTQGQALVGDALQMATWSRLPMGKTAKSLLFHSDRGSQYAGLLFQNQLREARIQSSMSRKGNCWDNAPLESFFATLKKEEVYRQKYLTFQQAKIRLFNYIEIFYNRRRRHSALGYLSPADYEQSLLTHAP